MFDIDINEILNAISSYSIYFKPYPDANVIEEKGIVYEMIHKTEKIFIMINRKSFLKRYYNDITSINDIILHIKNILLSEPACKSYPSDEIIISCEKIISIIDQFRNSYPKYRNNINKEIRNYMHFVYDKTQLMRVARHMHYQQSQMVIVKED